MKFFCPERLTLRFPKRVGCIRRTYDDLCVPIDCEAELTCPLSHVERKLKLHYHGDNPFWDPCAPGLVSFPLLFLRPTYFFFLLVSSLSISFSLSLSLSPPSQPPIDAASGRTKGMMHYFHCPFTTDGAQNI
ncbi:uncharacterized protein BO87DRAFT_79802 [Aspergillus neoniger CBS 115656]|uniref:Uncharacterized protein n=1 Tax=Aspergillus neoniger (strain CBS 115656) TaxID=1448310 RepID=A0A318YZ43_ASPNB|nr:hypothetical protein BO87DRAFT_79802 [Aspergillus neoniger CBS 115656]PYH39277.1 hypothetical protein BO87DRAFT_79802 [Aspergillus neoniger CBS 115656]